MRGLLMKDIYVMSRELKAMGILLLVFVLVPKSFTQSFAIIYASMLPITALSYDEQAKWNRLAATMPYKKRDIVLSKYIIGVAISITTVLLATASQLVYYMVKDFPEEKMIENLATYSVLLGAAFILLSLNLPMVFKLGVEKGRMLYIMVTVAFAVIVVGSTEVASGIWSLPPVVLSGGSLVIGIVALLISIQISIAIYKKKEI